MVVCKSQAVAARAVLHVQRAGLLLSMRMRSSPNAKTIIMAGLEPSGAIPALSDITSHTVAGEVNGIRAALGNILKHSYFITSQMGSQLSRPKLSGTLPIIYVFLARSEKTIRDVSLVGLDKDGKLHPLDEAGFVPVSRKEQKSYSPEATARSVRSTTSRRTFRTKAFRTAVS